MPLKDYYKILELEPSATIEEIKKSYRRLAQQYHPDKNSGIEYASSYFEEIKEAYEVLTNPEKKSFYLQQRWYQQSLGKKEFQSQPVTPPLVLKKFIELDKYISGLDSFRMNRHSLHQYICNLLNEETIDHLKKFNEEEINKVIIDIAMKAAGCLELKQAKDIAEKLYSLSKNPDTIKRIDSYLQQIKKKNRLEKYKVYFIILITLLICLLIYIGSR